MKMVRAGMGENCRKRLCAVGEFVLMKSGLVDIDAKFYDAMML